MIDLEKFSGDLELQGLLQQVIIKLEECATFIRMDMPPVTYSHVKSHMERADRLSADVIQLVYELSLALHLKNRESVRRVKALSEEAVEEYGIRSRWICERVVDGTPEITDMRLVADCIKTCIDSLSQYTWIIKSNKQQVCDTFEKAK